MRLTTPREESTGMSVNVQAGGQPVHDVQQGVAQSQLLKNGIREQHGAGCRQLAQLGGEAIQSVLSAEDFDGIVVFEVGGVHQ